MWLLSPTKGFGWGVPFFYCNIHIIASSPFHSNSLFLPFPARPLVLHGNAIDERPVDANRLQHLEVPRRSARCPVSHSEDDRQRLRLARRRFRCCSETTRRVEDRSKKCSERWNRTPHAARAAPPHPPPQEVLNSARADDLDDSRYVTGHGALIKESHGPSKPPA